MDAGYSSANCRTILRNTVGNALRAAALSKRMGASGAMKFPVDPLFQQFSASARCAIPRSPRNLP
jgi:hypothetical protein